MAQIQPGEWVWIDNVENPLVQGVAIWSVTEQNVQASWHLKYKSVVEGWTQVVNCGVNYKLIIECRHDGVLTKYETLVFVSVQGGRRVAYFKPYKPILP